MNFSQWYCLMESRLGFHLAIDKKPNDWTNWLIYADWLEENNEEILAKLIRLVHRKKQSNRVEKKIIQDEIDRLYDANREKISRLGVHLPGFEQQIQDRPAISEIIHALVYYNVRQYYSLVFSVFGLDKSGIDNSFFVKLNNHVERIRLIKSQSRFLKDCHEYSYSEDTTSEIIDDEETLKTITFGIAGTKNTRIFRYILNYNESPLIPLSHDPILGYGSIVFRTK